MKQRVTNIYFDTDTKIITVQLEDHSVWQGKNYSDSTSSMTFKWDEIPETGEHSHFCRVCNL